MQSKSHNQAVIFRSSFLFCLFKKNLWLFCVLHFLHTLNVDTWLPFLFGLQFSKQEFLVATFCCCQCCCCCYCSALLLSFTLTSFFYIAFLRSAGVCAVCSVHTTLMHFYRHFFITAADAAAVAAIVDLEYSFDLCFLSSLSFAHFM